MSIAITEEHRALAQTVAGLLTKHQSRAAARTLLEAEADARPAFWAELSGLGLLGLHIPEEHGGSGFGLAETLVVAEQMGRFLAPGPFVPTVVTSAVLTVAGPGDLQKRLLPGLADGSVIGAAALGGEVSYADGAATGKAGVVISGHLADVLLVPAGDDVLVIEKSAGGVQAEVPANLDQSRRAARVRLDAAPATVLPGARGLLTGVARAVLAAEAAGIASETTEQAAEYAKVRQQFGRPIATFQAVKHHCANMLVEAELATAVAWDAGRAGLGGGDQLRYTAAIAATLAVPAAAGNASLNIQVHGGIGFTWEHDAHLYLRRAAAIAAVVDAEQAAIEVTDLVRRGVRRAAAIDLPAEAEPIRAAIGPDVARLRDLSGEARKQALIETGYVMPHWPKPWGRDASAVEQLVIEQEFAAAGIKRPSLGITSWIILTLIQYGHPDQIARWVLPALSQDVIWCQLFSEPGAGSDAAGIRTRATRVNGDGPGGTGGGSPPCTEEVGGGWRINGQKVWTSGAREASFGLATVRTNPDAPKHQGITTMVIDMHAPGVTVRPLKMPTGNSDFNEVFFDDVFVPDANVVGPVDAWLDRGPRDARQRERQHRRRRQRHGDAGRSVHRPARRAPGAAGRRGRAGRQADLPHARVGRAEPAQRVPGGGGRRPGSGGQHRQAAAVRSRPRVGRDHGRAGRAGRRLPGRPRRDGGHARAGQPGHVDRRRHVGDQAEPDSRADTRPAP